MRINIHYRHVSHSDDLSQNIVRWLEQQLHSGKAADGLHVDLFFSKSTPYTKSSLMLFECHLRARAPWLSREVFIKDQNEDFWKLVTSCGDRLRKQIERDITQKRDERRQSQRSSLTG